MSPKQWGDRVKDALSGGPKGVVEAGQALAEAKRSLPHGSFEGMISEHVGIDPSTAQRLMAIGRHEVVANPAHWAAFPASWRTLYELTKVPTPALLEAIATGRVTHAMERREAAALFQLSRPVATANGTNGTNGTGTNGNRTKAFLPPTPPGVEVRCADSATFSAYKGVVADLAVFSPPYNVGVAYDTADDALSHEAWCQLIADVGAHLADDAGVGRICVNFPTGIDRRPYRPLLPSVLEALGDFAPEAVITWDKGTTGNRTSWGSWRSPSDPAIRDRTELIAVFRTANHLRVPADALAYDEGRRVSPWLEGERFMELTQDLWSFAPARRDGSHPTPFPVELPRRVLQLYGWPGCTVVDPFAGSGTTGVAALELGAGAVLIDVSQGYCDVMRRRLAALAEVVA